jgi:transcriptional regulator with XRE-family HTH domain
LGRQIKVARERAGLSQKELGDRIGYGEETISSVATGEGASATPEADPPAVWERLADRAVTLDEAEADSPLDSTPPAAPEPDEEDAETTGEARTTDVSDSPESSAAPPGPAAEVPVPAARKPGRPPASLRVAEELRTRRTTT